MYFAHADLSLYHLLIASNNVYYNSIKFINAGNVRIYVFNLIDIEHSNIALHHLSRTSNNGYIAKTHTVSLPVYLMNSVGLPQRKQKDKQEETL